MRKNTFLRACLCLLVSITLFYSCRKFDHSPHAPKPSISTEDRFFEEHRKGTAVETAIVNFLRAKNDKLQFIDKTAGQIGYPYWDKMREIAKPNRSRYGRTGDDSLTSVYAIPFVRDSQHHVNAAMLVGISGQDTSFSYVCDWQYRRINNVNLADDEAENLAVFLMILNNDVFGYENFRILDSSLFRKDGASASKVSLAKEGAQPVLTGREMYLDVCQTVAVTVPHCYYPDSYACYNAPGKCDQCELCRDIFYFTFCWQEWIYNSGGGEGGGPGSGGGGDGTPPEPCDPGGMSRGPGGGGGGGDLPPCDDGGEGWEPEPEIPTLELPESTYVKDAEFQNVSTYITPSGVAVTLPPDSKVIFYDNTDVNILPNGAVYAIELDNGDRYISTQKQFLQAGASVVPRPEYDGFFKINRVTNQIDFTNPLPAGQLGLPQPVNGKIRAVRMMVKKNSNGVCQMVRELVDYEPRPNAPSSYNDPSPVNYDIEYLQPVAGTLSDTENLQSCPGYSIGGMNNPNTSKYVDSSGQALVNFLNTSVKSDVRIYLYDASTQLATHTITKTGIVQTPVAERAAIIQKFNNNSFTPADGEIVIKASIENKQWRYDVQYNRSRLGPVHPKVQGELAEVMQEIRRQVDEEVENLRGVGRKAGGETIIVDNGERFYKADMDLLMLISAICDFGKHIIKEAAMPESTWDKGGRAGSTDAQAATMYNASPFKIPAVIGGAGDQLIEEATGAVQFAKMILEAIRKPRATFDNIYQSVKSLNKDKIKQLLASASGYDNYTAGGDRATYQGGRHTVQAAMILLGPVKALTKGREVVREAGAEMIGLQKFIPDGTTGHPSATALKNAADNNLLVKNLDDEKLLTKNISNGNERVVVIDKSGEVYNNPKLNNVDQLDDDVLKAADAHDLADAADNGDVYVEMRDYKQNFINGKKFERRITNDPNTKASVALKANIDLSSHQKLNQVQLKTSTGDYFVADEVYIKMNPGGQYEVVINEIKIGDATPFTTRQNQFLTDLRNGQVSFELRNTRFNGQNGTPNIPQGTMLNVQSMIKSAGNGSVNSSATFTKFNPQSNTWN